MQVHVIQQSEPTAAHRRVPLVLLDSTDGVSPKTGMTGVGRLSKLGAASAATSGSLVEVDATNMPGLYYIELLATEVDTLGLSFVSYVGTGCLAGRAVVAVVPFDPYATDKTGFSLSAAGNTAIRDTIITDATPFAGASVAAIKAKTDSLTFTTPNKVDTDAAANVAAIKAKTDNLPAAPAAVSDIPSANITAIKARTDLLPSVAAGATGGLPTVDAAGAVKVQSGTGANQIDLAAGKVKLDSTGMNLVPGFYPAGNAP